MGNEIQYCHECGNPTDRCEDDAIYIGHSRCSIGPLCEDCYDDVMLWVLESDVLLKYAYEAIEALRITKHVLTSLPYSVQDMPVLSAIELTSRVLNKAKGCNRG